MLREIKEFVKSCLKEKETLPKGMLDPGVGEGSEAYECGLFSLRIVDTGPRQQVKVVSTATYRY